MSPAPPRPPETTITTTFIRYPERTAVRSIGQTQEHKTWPTRQAMVKEIRRQEERPASAGDWIALQALDDTEE